MGKYTIFYLFENPRRGMQARNFTKNVPKILNLKSSSEQIFFRKLSLGAPEPWPFEPVKVKFCFLRGSLRQIDSSGKRNRQLALELQNSHVCEKRSKSDKKEISRRLEFIYFPFCHWIIVFFYCTVFPSFLFDYESCLAFFVGNLLDKLRKLYMNGTVI